MFVVRRATEDDTEAIGHVHRRSIREICGAHYPPDIIEAWAAPRKPEHYSKAVRDKDFYVAEDAEGTVVGFGVLNRETQEVEAVYIHPEVKRRGAGMKILRTLEGLARDAGLKTLHLNASLNGVAFYERAGYAWLGQGAHRLANGVEIACVLMSKSLTGEAGGAEGD